MGIVRYTVANGQILAESRDGVAKRYVGDPLGSTAALVDTTGAFTDTFTYWPYGEERTRTGTTPTPFRFGGTLGYYRDDAGRTYVRARTLFPKVGRWATADPHPATDVFQATVYAKNNPIGLPDPAGLDPSTLPTWPTPEPCPGDRGPDEHGNWCGAKLGGGQRRGVGLGTLPPCDCIDAACEKHDKCLGVNSSKALRKTCHAALCAAAKACAKGGCGGPTVAPCNPKNCKDFAWKAAKVFCNPLAQTGWF